MEGVSVAEKMVQTCFACTMCNKCGRFNKMKTTMGVRRCYKCGNIPEDNNMRICPKCGGVLPPPFPE